MALTYLEDQIEWSPHDLCLAVWHVLNCDTGTAKRDNVDPELVTAEPITVSQCGITAVTLTRQINEAVEDIDPSGQANTNAAYRRIPPTTKGWSGLAEVSSRISPLVYSLLDKGAPIIDANHANTYIGVEEGVVAAESCPSCNRTGATCRHSVGLMTIHNAWCGDERHPQYPFVAMFHKSLVVEPLEETIRVGRGFSTQQYAWTLQENTGWIDPYAIDPRAAGNSAKWAIIPIHADVIDPSGGATPESTRLTAVLDGCNCGACVSPLT